MLQILFLLHTLAQVAVANVEKIIFTGPPPSRLPGTNSTLSSLKIHTLTHNEASIRTTLDRVFASQQSGPRGLSSWVLLANLTESQRYELRICWSALEPTRVDIKAHVLDVVLEDPGLLQSLNTFSASRRDARTVERSTAELSDSPSLLIEIQAAADYFTDNKELMSNPPPVLVDLILDPFLLNVLPHSLSPTVCYLLLLSVATWFMARWFSSSLLSVANLPDTQVKKEN
ncbi:hypothetical protein C2857_007083 [Epichloe festucae Fl1]|uniref:Uncharacterized protein n=1 Tax=Epichloe festucae (strain Fl1) TaxID=877507 RepID=A0A7S9PUL9_EPIFF|nr:hypothetical protein C2857_007083 [Epichloe festucae Fl1]